MDILQMLPAFGGLAQTLLAFVVALSVIVAIHEYGHYIVARWCGIHAEVFSVGFGPRLASWRDKRGTQWQIAALPLGGYVKFLGDSDPASAGTDQGAVAGMTQAQRRRTMMGAPLWARSATVAAGPAFNFVLSILVFSGVMLVQGQARAPLTIETMQPMPQQVEALQPGDTIRQIAGQDVPDFAAFAQFVDDLPVDGPLDYTIDRDGQTLTVPGPYPYPPLVAGVAPQSAAMAAGLQSGDYITAVNGDPIASFEGLRQAVGAADAGAIDITVWRDGETFERSLTPRQTDVPLPGGGFESRRLIGVTGGMFFTPERESPGALTALGQGVGQTWTIVVQSLSGLYHMITGAISSCNLSGPIGIAETSGAAAAQGVTSFIWFIAILSTAIGFINLFPVPVLDGGHLAFFAYEAVAGRPPSDRAVRILMAAGFSMVITLMLFAITNDIFCP